MTAGTDLYLGWLLEHRSSTGASDSRPYTLTDGRQRSLPESEGAISNGGEGYEVEGRRQRARVSGGSREGRNSENRKKKKRK